MRRRDFIAILGGASAAWPRATGAQQAGDARQPRDGIRRIGVLMSNRPDDSTGQAYAAALTNELGALDWHEGANLQIEWRWTRAEPALYERYATELVALAPEAIVAQSSPSIAALRERTSTIPIVFVRVADPVVQGFVASLSHPGGNITGFSDFEPEMVGKWLGMLTQIRPAAQVAVLYNPATAPQAILYLRAFEAAASSFAVGVNAEPVQDDAQIEAAMGGLARKERSAIFVIPEAFTVSHREIIVASTARYRLPAIYGDRASTMAGGLMSYGTDTPSCSAARQLMSIAS